MGGERRRTERLVAIETGAGRRRAAALTDNPRCTRAAKLGLRPAA